MRIAISEHAGFALREAVKLFLTAEDRRVLDLDTHSTDPVDYSDYAEPIGQADSLFVLLAKDLKSRASRRCGYRILCDTHREFRFWRISI
jgi:hypothetical protein